ncbi:MAG: hypothetical protein M8467_00935 [Anaerolineae bacterium]|nr:hypothetical protein [Anaerolineae bacterium]
MYEQRIPLEDAQQLTLVEMAGNVLLEVWDQPELLIRLPDDREEHLTIEQTEAGPALSARVSCEIQVPGSLPVVIRQAKGNLKVDGLADLNAEQVRGNLKLEGVDRVLLAEVYGNLKVDATTSLRVVGTVYGDASLSSVENADLQNVRGSLLTKGLNRVRASRIGGNLQVKALGGALDVDRVGGNALLKSVDGPVTLDQVAGNLIAKDLNGGAQVARIGGNLVLSGGLGQGHSYHFQADGNATVRLPEGTNAHVTANARGKILTSLALQNQERSNGRLTGTLGEGGAELAIEVRGNVILGGGPESMGAGFGEEISRQVEEGLQAIDLEAISRQVADEMEAATSRLRVKLESVDWEHMGLRAQQAVERAMERLQRDMDRAVESAARHQERLERRLEREQRRQEWRKRRHEREAQAEPWTEDGAWGREGEDVATSPDDSELEEQRLTILKMVEQGQITPEEAEMLLDALE